jgi:hypothetical protein
VTAAAADSPPDDMRAPKSRRRLIGRRISDLANSPDEWVTPKAIASHYDVPEKTVTKWIQSGVLKAQKFPGRITRVQVRWLWEFEGKTAVLPAPSDK